MKKTSLLILCFLIACSLLAQNVLQKVKQESPASITRSKPAKNANAKAVGVTNIGFNTPTPNYPLELVTVGGDGFVHTQGSVKLGTYNDGSSGWFGTYSNHPLNFFTNYNNPSATLDVNGSLGIGTVTPADFTKLHVNGSAILSEKDDEAEQILIGTNTPNNEAKLYILNRGFPNAVKIDGKASTTGNALHVIGGTLINGDLKVTGSISKGSGTFQIDHPQDPLNKYLYHSFVESPDMMNVYNGNTTTDADGNASVQLPAYFEALNMDYRYQLTPIGAFAQAIVFEKVKNNAFKIKTDKPNVEVSWQVTGVRNDAYARQNRVQVEVPKPATEKGKYLHPEAFGAGSN